MGESKDLAPFVFRMWDLFDCMSCGEIAGVQVLEHGCGSHGGPIAECRQCRTKYRVGVQLTEIEDADSE